MLSNVQRQKWCLRITHEKAVTGCELPRRWWQQWPQHKLHGVQYLPVLGCSELASLLPNVKLNTALCYRLQPLDGHVQKARCPSVGINSHFLNCASLVQTVSCYQSDRANLGRAQKGSICLATDLGGGGRASSHVAPQKPHCHRADR